MAERRSNRPSGGVAEAQRGIGDSTKVTLEAEEYEMIEDIDENFEKAKEKFDPSNTSAGRFGAFFVEGEADKIPVSLFQQLWLYLKAKNKDTSPSFPEDRVAMRFAVREQDFGEELPPADGEFPDEEGVEQSAVSDTQVELEVQQFAVDENQEANEKEDKRMFVRFKRLAGSPFTFANFVKQAMSEGGLENFNDTVLA